MSDPLYDIFREKAETDGLYAIAHALGDVAYQLKCLGVGDAATTQGALELVATEIKNGSEAIASAMTPLTVQKYEDV